jgi:hypothetical protein
MPPPQDLQELLAAVQGFVSAGPPRRFAMAPDALDSPALASLVTDSFPLTGGEWVLRDPTDPQISGDAVVMVGDMDTLLGLAPARLHVAFDLADAGLPSLLVQLPPLDQPRPLAAWNLGNAYPVWSEQRSVLTTLEFDTPAFWWSSIARTAGDGHPPVTPGLTFGAGLLRLDGVLGALTSLPGFQLQDLHGAVTGPSSAPLMTLAAAPVTPIPIAPLDLPFTFAAVSGPVSGDGKIQIPPPPVDTWLQLGSQVQIGNAPPIPILLRFSGLGNTVTLVADLRQISQYAMAELQAFVGGAPISTMLDSVVKIGDYVGLRDLSVIVATDPLGIAGIGLSVGTTQSITVVPGWVELPDVRVDFMVDTPESPSVSALLVGRFNFLDDVPVTVTATYPGLVFTGSVQPDQPIPLGRIVARFVPSVTQFPDISLNQLYAAADFTQHRYAFQLVVSSAWKIPIGIARFELEEALLALAYDGSTAAAAASGFSGEIAATAVLLADDDTEIARFFADWKLPGANFVLEGRFPEIDLTKLATTLTGGGVPNAAGVPEIVLRDSLVRLRMGEAAGREQRLTGDTSFRFDLATTIDAAGIGKATLAFQVRKGTDGATGFAAGLVVQPGWTPDQLWSGLRDVMEVLTIKDAGLILSSITDEDFTLPDFDQFPYVPAAIRPGVTFFSSVTLDGDVFSLLRDLFDHALELDLYAYINPSKLTDSEIKVVLPGDAGKNAVSFTGLEIDLKPGAGELSIKAGARFSMFGERLTLVGIGTIALGPPPTVGFSIAVADWVDPFGITGLTIETFGLGVTISSTGLGVGVLGAFAIGADPLTRFVFKVGGDVKDFEVPDAFVCSLESKTHRPLKVTDLVEQFTSLDLSEVPLLDGLAFVQLSFYVVADPSGWIAPDGHLYPAGIGIDADLSLYDWELLLKLEVGEKRGILADGSLSKPIEIADLLKISDVPGDKGPRLKIDTSGLVGIPVESRMEEILARRSRPLPEGVTYAVMPLNPYVLRPAVQDTTYFSASGAVRVLGLYEAFAGSITSDGFEVNFHSELADIYRADFMAAFSKTSGFEGHASGNFDFSLDFPDGVSIDGWPLLPPITVKGPNAWLAIDVVLKLTEARVALELEFNWGSFHINPKFALDASQVADMLADLWNRIVEWIQHHVKTFFADVLADATRFVEALANGFIWAGQSALEIARTLYHLFHVDDVIAMAGYLVDATWFGFTEMVDALMEVLDVGFEAAVAALRAVGDTCAVATNQSVIYSGAPARREGAG